MLPRPSTRRAVPAVTRAAAILRLLGSSPTPLGVHPIARALGLVPSTCLHILRALVAEELVAVDPETKRYSLDAGVVALARGFLARDRFGPLAQPLLERLAARHGVTAIGIEVASLDHMIVTAIAPSPLPLRLQVDLGSRFPALISASGRCLAAFGGHPRGEITKRFRSLRWAKRPTLATWRKEVELTRRRGYGVDRGNYIHGVTVVAAPLRDGSGTMARGLAAVAMSDAMPPSRIDRLGTEMLELAATVSSRLGSA